MSTVKANTIEPASGGTVTITGAALTTPALGTPASGTLTNCTGLPASAVVNTPAGGISATTVQGAIDELDTEKFDKSGGSVSGDVFVGKTSAVNGARLTVAKTSGVARISVQSSANDVSLYLESAGVDAAEIYYQSSTSQLQFKNGGVTGFLLNTSGHLLPGADNAYNHGSGADAIKQIYTNNSVIVTSDGRLKTARPYSAKERAAARRCRDLGIVYQWNDSIAEKGADKARLHFGTTVQSVIAAFEAEGLDPMRYGVVCYDEWQAEVIEHPAVEAREAVPAVPEVWEEREVDITIRVNGEDRPAKRTVLQLLQPAVPAQPAVQAREAYTETVREAGNRYSLRLDQLAFFIATAGAGA